MSVKAFFLFMNLYILQNSCLTNKELTREEIIKLVNENNLTWKAGYTGEHSHRKGGIVILSPLVPQKGEQVLDKAVADYKIPEYFDARERWPQCKTIMNRIVHQGKCGSCWAISSSAVMNDRYCILNKGRIFEFSAEDLLTCCTYCLLNGTNGCAGGDPFRAFFFWKTRGVVSGGDVNSKRGCKPYSSEAYSNGEHLRCQQKCTNPEYRVSYSYDKKFGSQVSFLKVNNIKEIQIEILNNGPVVGKMRVYQDFDGYKGGVYKHTFGKSTDEIHGVRILGWGTDKNDGPYWIVANSWGREWGERGFFKIVRGSDHCEIEEIIFMGKPRSEKGIEINPISLSWSMYRTDKQFILLLLLLYSLSCFFV